MTDLLQGYLCSCQGTSLFHTHSGTDRGKMMINLTLYLYLYLFRTCIVYLRLYLGDLMDKEKFLPIAWLLNFRRRNLHLVHVDSGR